MSEQKNLKSLALFLILLLVGSTAYSHPEDEFCNDGGLDPLLCAQLAALDSDTASPMVLDESYIVTLDRSRLSTAMLYIRLGVDHILPMGFDHLLFVLALLLVSYNLRSVILQVSCFTLAHTVTLFASTLGLVSISGRWVEVLIAASIIYVGLENIVFKIRISRRLIAVFLFGLLHGLGFAGALSEIGVPETHFVSALLGFNIGVELGQLLFAIAVYLPLLLVIRKDYYRSRVLIPLSCCISAIALFWALERSGLVF